MSPESRPAHPSLSCAGWILGWIVLLVAALPTGAAPADADPGFVYLCQNAGAGGYESFPDLCRLADGRILAVFYAGWDHIALPKPELPNGGRIVSCISTNEGRTWSSPRTIIDTPKDDRDPSITQLRDGRLVCSFFTREPTGEVVTFLSFSSDAGEKWSLPRPVASGFAVSAPVRELSTGRLILGIYSEDEQTHHAFGAVIFSDDHGRTWSTPSIIDNAGARLDAETDVIELRDGTLWAAQRGGSGAQMHFATSRDRGRSWTKSVPIGFQAHCPYLHRLKDGTILLAVREFENGPWKGGTTVRFSRDEAKTWSKPFLIDSCSGSYPSMVDLKDGTILIAYYEEKAAKADIRVRRLRLDGDLMTLLPVDGPPVAPGPRR